MLKLEVFTNWLDAKKVGMHHRQFLLLELATSEVKTIIDRFYEHFDEVLVVTGDDSDFACKDSIPANRYQQYLGRQTQALVFDASAGFQLNALYAVAGMVKANGIVLVILPFGDLTSSRDSSFKFSFGQQGYTSLFNVLFKSRVNMHNGAYLSLGFAHLPSAKIIGSQHACGPNTHQILNNFETKEDEKTSEKSPAGTNKTQDFLSSSQQKIVDNIVA